MIAAVRGARAALLLAPFTLGSAHAVEMVVRDLGLRIDSLGEEFDYEIDAGSGSDRFENGRGLSLFGHYSFAGEASAHGFVLGAEALIHEADYGDDGEMEAWGGRLNAGWGWSPAYRWLVLGGPYAGWSQVDFDIGGATGEAVGTFDGWRSEFGLQAMAAYRFDERWSVALNAAYGLSDYALSAGDRDLDMDGRAFTVGLGVTWRFATLPTLLD